MSKPSVLVTALTMILLTAGCASRAPTPPVAAPGTAAEAGEQARPAPPPVAVREPARSRARRPAVAPLPPAARSLTAQAQAASDAGDHEAAAGYLERALRVAPSHPVLWQHLAVVRYRQGDYDKVEGLALKSNSLAATDPALRRENWRLIAEVRRLRGDRQGAEAALDEMQRLSSTHGGD